ncbi:MAG: hypothetical protein J1F35_06340 [Erysipelotrichales bacterium]|nr:hypothetical protein [Erysipelotrichales bacterium]
MKSLVEFIQEGKLKDKFGYQVSKMILGKDVAVKPLKYLSKIVEAMSDCGYKYMEDIANKCLESVDINNKKEFKKYLIDNKIVAQWKDIKNEKGFIDNLEFVKYDVGKEEEHDWVVIYGEIGKRWTILRWGFSNWEGTVVPYRDGEETGYVVSIDDIKKTLIKEAIEALA